LGLVQQSLVERIAPRLRAVAGGSYARQETRGRASFSSDLQATVWEILNAVGVKVARDARVPGTKMTADFRAGGTYIFTGPQLSRSEEAELGRSGARVLLVTLEKERSSSFDSGVRVTGFGKAPGRRRQTIFLDDPSFNFDYAHILPATQKCSVMHGHTSSVLVEIAGTPVDGMVVDFGLAKDVIRRAVRSLDHKLFINEKYVTGRGKGTVTLNFRTVHGPFAITAPRATTVLLDGEATVENLAREVLSRIAPKMPENVTSVGVYVYEGLNKGSHLLADIHSGRVRPPRKKP
jgi:6-pyruvoyl-tetrahydropterin synthase